MEQESPFDFSIFLPLLLPSHFIIQLKPNWLKWWCQAKHLFSLLFKLPRLRCDEWWVSSNFQAEMKMKPKDICALINMCGELRTLLAEWNESRVLKNMLIVFFWKLKMRFLKQRHWRGNSLFFVMKISNSFEAWKHPVSFSDCCYSRRITKL